MRGPPDDRNPAPGRGGGVSKNEVLERLDGSIHSAPSRILQGAAAGRLHSVLEDARRELKCGRNKLTVLSAQVDPYRFDTPAGHRDGAWPVARHATPEAPDPATRSWVRSRMIAYARAMQKAGAA